MTTRPAGNGPRFIRGDSALDPRDLGLGYDRACRRHALRTLGRQLDAVLAVPSDPPPARIQELLRRLGAAA